MFITRAIERGVDVKVIAEWPTPIFLCGEEIGEARGLTPHVAAPEAPREAGDVEQHAAQH